MYVIGVCPTYEYRTDKPLLRTKGDVFMYARNRQIKKLFFVLLVVLPLLYGCAPSESDPDAVKADPNTTDQHIAIAAMNESAENVFQYTRRDEPEKARTEMNALARQVEQLNFAGLTSVEGMNALTSAIVEGKQIYSAARFDRNRALLAAGRIRLAVDALDQSRRPMWLQYDSVFQQDVADMRSAMEATDADRLKQLYQRTRSHYEMIRPALLISLDLSKSGALDSLLNAMDRRIATGPLQELRPLIEHYATLLNDTFQRADIRLRK